MMRRLLSRSKPASTVAIGALTAGLGLAGVAGVLTVHPHKASPAALGALPASPRSAPSPYFVCLAYAQAWGICIGPPTN